MFSRLTQIARRGAVIRGSAPKSKVSLRVIRVGIVTTALGLHLAQSHSAFAESKVDLDAIRKDIEDLLERDEAYDDGSYGPLLVRLAWHASGTFDVSDMSGGSSRASMRFKPEAGHGANAGLGVARALLENVKANHPKISYADLWIFAGCVAIEYMGGPTLPFRLGRKDCTDSTGCTPDGRLPDAAQGAAHIRDVFYRMGFNDQEITALNGAHCLGRCHLDRSGFSGPWTRAPTTFSNDYFVQLLENEWTEKKWNGPKQFEDPTGELMMLNTDMTFKTDPKFREWSAIYAKDGDRFAKDFAAAWTKLTENGVDFSSGPWWKFW